MPVPNITSNYDEEADVLYISLGTGEPSYCEEINDFVLVEIGYFSHTITGFQVLDIKHHDVEAVEIRGYVKKAVQKEQEFLERIKKQRTLLPGIISKNIESDRRLRAIFQEA